VKLRGSGRGSALQTATGVHAQKRAICYTTLDDPVPLGLQWRSFAAVDANDSEALGWMSRRT
jgi:hypothetical protein